MPSSEQLARNRLRSRFEAAVLDGSAGDIHKLHGQRKQAAIGAMKGTVVELGPGTGVNMRYYAPGVHVIGIEPNPNMHGPLRQKATAAGVDLEILTLPGEALEVPDASVDAVVGTLVLCGVDDLQQVLAEVVRVLKPDGTYFFIEHVRAPEGTFNRRVQRLVKRPHRFLANGCEVDRDTASAIRHSGFSSVELTELDTVPTNLYVRHQIVGTATK